MKSKKLRTLCILSIILMATVFPFMSINLLNTANIVEDEISTDTQNDSISDLRTSLPATNYEWWNKSWTFRIPVGLTAVGNQQNAPVELFVNFTELL